MNKNSILAIALSTIVVMVSLFINQRILQKNVDNAVYSEQTVQSNAEENTSTEKVITNNELVKPTSTKTTEEKITINTEKAEIILTNRGGDIISYKLLNHKDVDTNEGVQMVDNVSDMNRACAISFGGINNSIINDNCNHLNGNTFPICSLAHISTLNVNNMFNYNNNLTTNINDIIYASYSSENFHPINLLF